ncbi:hypothetical protein NE236_42945 [Actinoallomurus purpureus]|uniref:hypothetical protein n=1 Tax=Actinoallomurus purpureus TaxID=478114 RepID=UPI0020920C0B|nr:hypothetical protein [Actinoallomurus purpureus]MCO6011725.1 hypothetical protein [Actinoallomurus purpureus]
MTAARIPRSRPGGTSPLSAHVEDIATSGNTPARQHAGTPNKAAGNADAEQWVNFSTYLPAPLRRSLKARCAGLEIEVREAVAQAVADWLEAHPADDA